MRLKALAARVLERNQARNSTATDELQEVQFPAISVQQKLPPDRSSGRLEWDASDWQAFYDERAGIAEFVGAAPRAEAEERAFECCIVEWLTRHLEPSEPDRCAWCEKVDQAGHSVVPFGTDRSGHTWLHPECWTAWYEKQRQEARRALTNMSVGVTSYPTNRQ